MAPAATGLSGYLKKEAKKAGLLNRSQKRFFRVEEIAAQTGAAPRLALCYYRRENDAEPRGWLFLGDVEAVRDAGPALFVVEHPSRSYVLHAADASGKKTWVEGLQQLVDEEKGSPIPRAAADPPLGGAADEYRSLYEDVGNDDLYDFEDTAKRETRRDDPQDDARRSEKRREERTEGLDEARYNERRDGGEARRKEKRRDKSAAAARENLIASPDRDRRRRDRDDRDDLDALGAEMDDILYDRAPPPRERPQRDAFDFVPPRDGRDDDIDSPPRRDRRDDYDRRDDRNRRDADSPRRRDRRDDEYDESPRRDREDDDCDRRDDDRDRAPDPTPARRPRKERRSTTPAASPLFDDEINLETEVVRPALDESDDRFENKKKTFAPSPKAASPKAASPAAPPKAARAATPEAAPAKQMTPVPSAPTKKKTPVRIARRGAGGDELAIDWDDEKPKKKAPSALARRLARGERPAKAKAKTKTKRAPKTPDQEESTDDVVATLAKERKRLARKAGVQGVRDEAEKAAKKKARDEKRRRKAEKAERKAAKAPAAAATSLFANAIKPDANFVEDDWDDSPAKLAPARGGGGGMIGGFGAVKPDANFVEDDWD